MVNRHWGLNRDPFAPGRGPFVETPGAQEAVERLVHVVESGDRRVKLSAPAGSGKSRILAEVAHRLRGPTRRVARVSAAPDLDAVAREFAERLGVRSRTPGEAPHGWRKLAEAVRLCRWQKLGVVLVVDDSQEAGPGVDWSRLARIDPHPATRLTLIVSGRASADGEAADPWELAVRLPAMSRTETAHYLECRLVDAGRVGPTFTPRAVTRLHGLTGGLPGGVDRLASLALVGGAVRRLEMISPEVVEGVAAECLPAGR